MDLTCSSFVKADDSNSLCGRKEREGRMLSNNEWNDAIKVIPDTSQRKCEGEEDVPTSNRQRDCAARSTERKK